MLGGFLVDYRRETGLGAAVAANQIGLERSMVAFALPFVDPADTLELKDILIACNLALAGTSGSMISAESCMSSDLEMVAVVRAAKIRALYRTPDGQPLTLDQAFRPNVVQHELDHVLGFTCLQRAIPGSLRELELQGKPKAEMSRVAEEYAALYDPDLVATLYGGDVPERH
jgi:peptide deformylase